MPDQPSPRPSAFTPWPASVAQRYRDQGLWSGERLYDALWATCQAQPTRLAVVSAEEQTNYADLFSRSAEIAARLDHCGIGVGDRVVIQLGNTTFFIQVILACLKLGVQPVLALPAQRRYEIGHVVVLSQSKAIIVEANNSKFDYVDMALRLEQDCPSLETIFTDLPCDNRQVIALSVPTTTPGLNTAATTVKSSDIALFLLSGGTTGLPKLIARTHDDYLLNARVASSVSDITADSVYLVALPAAHNFPFGCPGIIGTLLAGGRVVMAPSPAPDVVFPLIDRHQVNITSVVPAVAMRWLDHDHSHDLLQSLQVLQVGGSRLPEQSARRVRPVLGCQLQQVFGMAEGLLNYTRLDDSEDVVCTTQGRPASEADEVRVVDDDGNDVATDCVGQLMTRGPYTIRGYYNAPEHNENSFTEQGYYISGDLVRQRADGNLVVEGRTKDVINRGGEKISAEELENLCLTLPAVANVAVVAMPDPELGEDICVFVVTHPDQSVDLSQLRQHLIGQGIASFKLPAKLVVLSELPVTNIGKVDKKALREYDAD